MPKSYTQENFIEKCNKVHSNKYNYSLSEFSGVSYKIKIVCPIHGEFIQRAGNHLRGNGCPKCFVDKICDNHDAFINKSKKIHGDKYDYSLVEYIRSGVKVKLICQTHGEFEMTPNNHLDDKGCRKCSSNEVGINQSLGVGKFIERSKLIHGELYNYDKALYINAHSKVRIKCNRCDSEFDQSPRKHSNGQGCPICNTYGNVSEPRLFNHIKNTFPNFNIVQQARPDWLLNSDGRKLQTLDIYFQDINIAIEYQGSQHFRPVSGWLEEHGFLKTKERDQRKYNLCKENGCKLFYFTYNKKDIPDEYIDVVYSSEDELVDEIKKLLKLT